ncbi:DUF971 domain-containing protein [Alphaproteobacteria bacterium]|nr:DUF971 domain-containing protein [Alphaproteobacteria bacterium]
MINIVPIEIKVLKNKQRVIFNYEGGNTLVLSASYLRSKSPSAENKKNLKDNKEFTDIKVTNIEKIGNYAIKISFNDLHNTGIYSWKYIFKLGTEHSNSLSP